MVGFVGSVSGLKRCEGRRKTLVPRAQGIARRNRCKSRKVLRMSESSQPMPPEQPVDDGQKNAETEQTSFFAKIKAFFLRIGTALGFVSSGKDKQSMIDRLKSYGVAAVISYGLFDMLTYSISFVIALKSFTASSGEQLTWKTFPAVFAIMFGINNFSRPLRIAGAALIAPSVDKIIVKPVGAFFARLRRTLFGGEAETESSSTPGDSTNVSSPSTRE